MARFFTIIFGQFCHDSAQHFIPIILYLDTFTDGTVLSYEISNTVQSQPSVKIVVEDGDYKELRDRGRVDSQRRGYIIGYRDCVSNPSEVCYIFHNDVSAYIILLWFSSELELAIYNIFFVIIWNHVT